LAERSSSGDSGRGPDPTNSGPARSGASTGAASGSGRPAPGLGEQFGRTRSALLGLIAAHIDLAKAEFSEIGGEIKRAAALGGAALLLLFFTGGLVVIGLILYLGEAIFGSIGWGVLDGTELLLGIAALLVLAIVDLSWGRVLSAFVVALGVGLVVAALLLVDWGRVGRDTAVPQWVFPMIAGLVVLGLLGALLGSPFGRGPAFGAGFVGAVSGALLGLLAAVNTGPRVAAAMGVAALLLFWPCVAAYLVFRHGVDRDKLRARFVPEKTIETTKETIEWVREQLPLKQKS
jgi:hypothetical protein